MLSQIISTVEVVLDAMKPTEKSKVLFTDFQSVYQADRQSSSFSMNVYEVIDDEEGEYKLIGNSARNLDKAALDALIDPLNITSTTYTDISNEQMTKGLAKVIEDEQIYGLTEADLILR